MPGPCGGCCTPTKQDLLRSRPRDLVNDERNRHCFRSSKLYDIGNGDGDDSGANTGPDIRGSTTRLRSRWPAVQTDDPVLIYLGVIPETSAELSLETGRRTRHMSACLNGSVVV